jgi:hypothetical protein
LQREIACSKDNRVALQKRDLLHGSGISGALAGPRSIQSVARAARCAAQSIGGLSPSGGSVRDATAATAAAIGIRPPRRGGDLFVLTARVASAIDEVTVFAVAASRVAIRERKPRSVAGKKTLALASLCGGARARWPGNHDRVPAVGGISSSSCRRGTLLADLGLDYHAHTYACLYESL